MFLTSALRLMHIFFKIALSEPGIDRGTPSMLGENLNHYTTKFWLRLQTESARARFCRYTIENFIIYSASCKIALLKQGLTVYFPISRNLTWGWFKTSIFYSAMQKDQSGNERSSNSSRLVTHRILLNSIPLELGRWII